MGFAVPAPVSFPGSAEGGRRGGRGGDALGAGSQLGKRTRSTGHLPKNQGGSTDWTVPALTLIHLIHVHVLTPPAAPSEPRRLSQGMPMVWKGALNGLWMDVFLHDRSRLLCDDVLPQEAIESPCLCGGSPSPPRFCPVATAALIGMRRRYFHCRSGWWSPWPVAGTFSVLWQLDTDGEPSCPFGPWSGACSPTCH